MKNKLNALSVEEILALNHEEFQALIKDTDKILKKLHKENKKFWENMK